MKKGEYISMKKMKIKILEEFSDSPCSREDGKLFRDTILLPKLVISQNQKEKLIIDFDDTYGVGIPFLKEAFGGLIEIYKYDKKTILKDIEFISRDDETVPKRIKDYLDQVSKDNKISHKLGWIK